MTTPITKEHLRAHIKKQMKQREMHLASPATEQGFREYLEMEIAVNEIALAAMDAEPVAWTDEQELRDVEASGCGYLFTYNPVTPHADERRVIKLYTAPPAPVCSRPVHPAISSEELDDETLDELIDFRRSTLEYHSQQGNKVQTIIHGVTLTALLELRERRAAMLQAGNSPVIPECSANMLQRWLTFGRAMQSVGSQLPRNLIAETESMLAAAPQQKDRIQCCLTHPQTALQVHPFEMLMSLPPKPKMYCPECEPGVAERIDMMKNISSPKVGE